MKARYAAILYSGLLVITYYYTSRRLHFQDWNTLLRIISKNPRPSDKTPQSQLLQTLQHPLRHVC